MSSHETRKFKKDDLLKHVKTGRVYKVITTAFLEGTLEEVYVYTFYGEGSPDCAKCKRVWVRSASEMEDGRFVKEPNE